MFHSNRMFLVSLIVLLNTSCIQSNGDEISGQFIQCAENSGTHEVLIDLGGESFGGRPLNCVSGSFVLDLSGCAPDGAYGLHRPTGAAGLVGLVDRWQDYGSHVVGVTSNFVNATQIYFSGGFNFPPQGYRESWTFVVDRIDGLAVLTAQGEISRYTCSVANRVI